MTASPVALWRHVSRGVRRLVSDSQSDRDINDEMQHFIEQATAAGIARGLSPNDARREAVLAFGNRTAVKEEVRASLWENMITALVTDTRYALRMLWRTPVFTLVIVTVISLGTGAVTTIFSAANSFLFRPLPGAASPGRLVQIDRVTPDRSEGTQSSYPFYTHLRDNNHTLYGVAAWSKVDLTLAVPAGGIAAYGNIVSANFFSVLGVQPALGRFFLPDEDQKLLANPVVVVSYDFWQAHLGGDSSIVGRTIGVNGHPFTLLGVAPRAFHGVFTPLIVSAWVPVSMQPWLRPNRSLTNAEGAWLWTFARMKDDVSVGSVRQELIALTASFAGRAADPQWRSKYSDIRLIALTGLPDDAHKVMLAFLAVLLGAATLVLLIASVNVAAMLSARALARQREMALRIALGAQRARTLRQLVTESLVLFTLGAVGGIAIAFAATHALERIPLPVAAPFTIELSPDLRVLAFALAVSLLTGLVFGLGPALRASRQDINSRLRNDTAGATGRRSLVNNTLVVGQLALSLVLLVSAGLLLRALDRGRSIDIGFDMNGVVTAPLTSESWGYDEARARLFFQQLQEKVAAIPGVSVASYAGTLPLNLSSSSSAATRDVAAPGGATELKVNKVQFAAVDVGYLEALHIPLLAGRPFATSDNMASARVAIINETLAKRLFPRGDALGGTFRFGSDTVTVAGIARNAKYSSYAEDSLAFVYRPLAQLWRSDQNLLVRVSGDIVGARNGIVAAVRSLDAALPPPTVVTMATATNIALLPQRVAALVAGSLGLVGLILATVGLYGIISYSASRRTREIGIRMALGAQRIDVQRIVVVEGMRLAGYGVLIGLALAASASRLLSAYLYGVSPLDAVTFTAMPALFVAVALVASYLPARRAARANPMSALRSA